MKAVKKILKSFYLYAIVCIILQTANNTELPASKKIPDGYGPLMVCLLSVGIVMLKNSDHKLILKKG